MRAIVTGASGMLGYQVLRLLHSRGYEVDGWSHSTKQANGWYFRRVDLCDYPSTALMIRVGEPSLVIHCAALTDVGWLEARGNERVALRRRELARCVNATATGCLAEAAKEVGARFVYVSTDAVYDGERPGRRVEDEPTKPNSIYAETKLEGEGRVLAAYPEALVARTTMFGWTLPTAPRPKFAEEILGALTARKPISLWEDAIFSPLHVRYLAETLVDLAKTNVSGILNVGSRDPISKFAFGRLLGETFGLDSSFVRPASLKGSAFAATRPRNVALDVSRLWTLPVTTQSVDEGVSRLYADAFDGTAEQIRGRSTLP